MEIYGVVPPAQPGGDPVKTKLPVGENTYTFNITAEGENNTAWTKQVYVDRYAAYELVEKSITLQNGTDSEEEVQNYTVSSSWNSEGTACTFTNTRIMVPVKVRKVDAVNKDLKLSGAHFSLQRKNLAGVYTAFGETDYVTSDGSAQGNTEGEFALSLPSGEYRLTETSAPGGYVILVKATDFTVSQGKFTLNTGQAQAEALDASGNVVDPEAQTPAETKTIRLTNTKGAELPSTGGPGTFIYTLSGLAFMAAALMYGFRMRRRERRINKSL
jgi:LPXTG-motif cell wall-anchored protein